MDRFACKVQHCGPSAVVVALGDVDLASCDTLAAVAAAQLKPEGQLIVDCSRITFMDSVGLRTLLQLQREAEVAECDFVLAAISDPVARVLRLSGTANMFRIRSGPSALKLVADGRSHSARPDQPPTKLDRQRRERSNDHV